MGDGSRLPTSIAAYLRPSFELAYRLTCDLDQAAAVAEEALIRAARMRARAGREALDLCFREVVASCRGSGGRAAPPERWDLHEEASELRRKVRAAIPGLPMPARAALVLREAFELPDEEIAEIVGVEPSKVAELVDAARIRLASPAAWSTGMAPAQAWRPAALGTAARGICAQVRASHHDEVDGRPPALDRETLDQHHGTCAACRRHSELIRLAHELTALATPPSLADSFWSERKAALEARWRRTRLVAPRGRRPSAMALGMAGLLVVLVALLLPWPGADRRGETPPRDTPAGGVETPREAARPTAESVRREPGAESRPTPPELRDTPPADDPIPRPHLAPAAAPPPTPNRAAEETEVDSPEARSDTTARAAADTAAADTATVELDTLRLDELRRLLEAYPEVRPGQAALRPLTPRRER